MADAVLLGLLRIASGGLLLPIPLHIVADVTIYLILIAMSHHKRTKFACTLSINVKGQVDGGRLAGHTVGGLKVNCVLTGTRHTSGPVDCQNLGASQGVRGLIAS